MAKYFKESEIIGLNNKLVLMLDKAREIAQTPFRITSGLRTWERNNAVGGATDSAHLKGLAVDILAFSGEIKFKIVSGLLKAGFKRIKIAPIHIHTDIDELKPQNVIFLKE